MGWLPWSPVSIRPGMISSQDLRLSPEANSALCKALRTDKIETVRDLLNSLILSECVYKAHDLGAKDAVKAMNVFREQFPAGLVTLQSVQCTLPHVHHRYLVASSPDTIYVSFIGTKLAKDVLVDANFFHRPIWKAADPKKAALPAAHRGFVERARRVPVDLLLARAQREKKKLLFCGHSLGGAVANICTLKILQKAADAELPRPPVACMTFGAPAIGNSALADRVKDRGWKDCFHSVNLPEDLIPRLLSVTPEGSADVAAEVADAFATVTPLQPPQRPARLFTSFAHKWRGSASRSKADRAHQFASTTVKLSRGEVGRPRVKAAALSEIAERSVSHKQQHKQDADSQHDQVLASQSAREASDLPDIEAQAQQAWPRAIPNKITEIWSSGRQMAAQGWRGTQAGGEEISQLGTSSAEEDGAVEALVSGTGIDAMEQPGAAQHSPAQPSASGEQRQTGWLHRLSQLQNLAGSAASTVGSVGQILPTSIHFGQTVSWPLPKDHKIEGNGFFPSSDIRSRILAGHRMPAYRTRALVLCSAISSAPQPPAPESGYIHLAEDIIPEPLLSHATADLQPLAPLDLPDPSSSGRWSWVPYVGNKDAVPQQADQCKLQIQLEGDSLSSLRQGRLLAFGSNWFPVRLGLQKPIVVPQQLSKNAGISQALLPESVNTSPESWGMQWLQKVLQSRRVEAEPSLQAEVSLPAAIASQVYHGYSSSDTPALELHLRSDFACASVPVAVRVPTVWLVGSSPSATRSIMSALSLQSPTARNSSPQPQYFQAAELIMDGAKWCNLLAAPIATPSLAVTALSYSLQPIDSAWVGPIRLAKKFFQGMQSWLVGPQAFLREASSASAVVLAMDDKAGLSQRQIARLRSQAERAGTGLIVACLGPDLPGAPFNLDKDFPKEHVMLLAETSGRLQASEVLRLRQRVFTALTGGTSDRIVSKL